MADKPAKPEQVLKIEPRNELHFKGKYDDLCDSLSNRRAIGRYLTRHSERFKRVGQRTAFAFCAVHCWCVCLLCCWQSGLSIRIKRLLDNRFLSTGDSN